MRCAVGALRKGVALAVIRCPADVSCAAGNTRREATQAEFRDDLGHFQADLAGGRGSQANARYRCDCYVIL